MAKNLFTGSLKKIDQLIFRNAKEIYFNEKFPNSLIIYSMQNQNKLEIKF